ncbi:hypothetical protein BJX99DRAFT_235311 [Aspergillus californicus]
MYLARINHAINQLYELSPILINSTHMTNSMDLIDVGTTQTTDHDMVDTKLTRFTSSWYEDFAHGFRTELVVSNPIEEREWEQLLLVELQVQLSSCYIQMTKDTGQELGSPGRNNGSLSACLDDHAKYEAVNHTKRLNVIYVLGEAVNLDLGRTERTILEYGKRLRSVGTNMDSSVVHFVQTHRDVQMGRGLAGLQANIRDDMALQGTIEIRLSTIDIFNVQANTYHDIIFVDPDSLQISTQPEEGSLFPVLEAEGLGTWNVHIRGISRFTKRETLWLAFSRFQNFIEVTVHEATERPGRDLVSATTSLPPETMTQERSSPGNGSSDERSATAVYHVKSSADRACSTMNGVRFDGAIINVYKEGPINSSYTSDRWGEDEIPVRPGDQSKGLNWNWFRDN